MLPNLFDHDIDGGDSSRGDMRRVYARCNLHTGNGPDGWATPRGLQRFDPAVRREYIAMGIWLKKTLSVRSCHHCNEIGIIR